jgi:hypothetical protein
MCPLEARTSCLGPRRRVSLRSYGRFGWLLEGMGACGYSLLVQGYSAAGFLDAFLLCVGQLFDVAVHRVLYSMLADTITSSNKICIRRR